LVRQWPAILIVLKINEEEGAEKLSRAEVAEIIENLKKAERGSGSEKIRIEEEGERGCEDQILMSKRSELQFREKYGFREERKEMGENKMKEKKKNKEER
jgi:hypothetical protein